MLHLMAMYAALYASEWESREAAERELVRLVDRHPSRYGPPLASWARAATEPEVVARCRRPLNVYRRHLANAYVPRSVPVWPICDAMPTGLSGPVALQFPRSAEWLRSGEPCLPELATGPWWHRYRRGTERMARRMLLDGASEAEVDGLLARMWRLEAEVRGDCDQWAEASASWAKWEGGYPCPKPSAAIARTAK